MERKVGEDAPPEEVVDALHDDGTHQQNGLGHAETDLQQTPFVEEDHHQRQQAGQHEENAQVGGRLRDLARGGFEAEGAQGELPGVAGEPRQGQKER